MNRRHVKYLKLCKNSYCLYFDIVGYVGDLNEGNKVIINLHVANQKKQAKIGWQCSSLWKFPTLVCMHICVSCPEQNIKFYVSTYLEQSWIGKKLTTLYKLWWLKYGWQTIKVIRSGCEVPPTQICTAVNANWLELCSNRIVDLSYSALLELVSTETTIVFYPKVKLKLFYSEPFPPLL